MKSVPALLTVTLASISAGWITGQLWLVGNWAAEAAILRLVAIAVPSNLIVAALFYYLLQGAVHQADGDVGLLMVLGAFNLVISLGVASWVAEAIGAGDAAKIGAHAFSWGMSYAYGQAFHDVRHGTWLHK